MASLSNKLRRRIAHASVWAQVEHPVGTAKVIRKVTSLGSSKKSKKASTSLPRKHGLEAANDAAGVPVSTTTRNDGIIAANIAARIPGYY